MFHNEYFIFRFLECKWLQMFAPHNCPSKFGLMCVVDKCLNRTPAELAQLVRLLGR